MSREEFVRLEFDDEMWRFSHGYAERSADGWASHEDGTEFRPDHTGSYAANKPEEAIANAETRLVRSIEQSEALIRQEQESLRQHRKLLAQLQSQEPSLMAGAQVEVECWRLVRAFFGSGREGRDKTENWFRLPNPLLGNIPPRDLLAMGRHEKLLAFIRTQLAENGP